MIVGVGTQKYAFSVPHDHVVVRLDSNGVPDPGFGSVGFVSSSLSTWDSGNAIVVQPDGKILIGGGYNNSVNLDFFLARYTSDGTLDSSFGGGGMVSTPVGNDWDDIYDLAIQSDGMILAAGGVNVGSAQNAVVLRYNSNGQVDFSFGSGGYSLFDFDNAMDICHAVEIQSDGKILLAGITEIAGDKDIFVLRLE